MMRRTLSPIAGTRSEFRFQSLALLLVVLGASRHVHAQASPAADGPSDISRMIGLSVAASGGPRDTLGLLVATVTRDGPADRAGITTGSRILAVNGLEVRLAPNDIGRRAAADSALIRFDRALRVTPPGSDVILRVAGGGLTRLVNVPVAVRRTSSDYFNRLLTATYPLWASRRRRRLRRRSTKIRSQLNRSHRHWKECTLADAG